MKQFIILTLALLLQLSVFANSSTNLSIEEKQKIESELKIFPNPVKNNQFTIAFQSLEMTEVRLVNITGKEFLKKDFDFPIDKAVIFVNEIPNGLYIIQIKTTEQQVISKKLMISRD